ncbi:hypothetical protein AURDEDRAFT_71900 [Auricularia subglabra TFB-10046 SS5]|nr:hypothetical protein AURDEDRAFT_71900 [Auricularia subglabra TFB-10046 SS5]
MLLSPRTAHIPFALSARVSPRTTPSRRSCVTGRDGLSAFTLARSPRGRKLEQIIHDICSRIQGFSSDHSADMKSLNSELFGWICNLDRVQRGQAALEAEGAQAYAALVLESYAQMIADAGGLAAWDMLSFEDRNMRWLHAREAIFRERGRAEFSKLSTEQKDSIDVWFWSGCCMHKELNSVVGGYAALSKSWAKLGLTPPIKLMNKDNQRVASSGTPQAKQADEASTGGAVKLLQLLAALVRHKDKKKGHQDVFKEFFAAFLLYEIEFPDVSNTRFQSYCDAAAFVLLHLQLLYDFMEHIRDLKTTPGWNNLELNVWNGLHDIPTQTELAVLAYYGQAVGHPYVARTRIPGLNALDLKPVHDEVKAHCKAIAEHPELLTTPLCSASTGCLGGAAWDRPDIIYCLQYRIQSYPHIGSAISAFFGGAYDTWVRFTSEFTEDGAIATSSKDDHDRIFLPATNDHNEAAVGWLRNFKARHPNATMAFFNALTRCMRNDTVPYIQQMDVSDRRFATAEARRRGALGRKRLERANILPYQRQKVKEKRIAMEQSARRKRELAERMQILLDGLDCTRHKHSDDVTERMTVAQIDAELEWHRHRGAKDAVPPKKDLKRKAEKLQALKKAIDAYNTTCDPETEWFGIEEGTDNAIDENYDVYNEEE